MKSLTLFSIVFILSLNSFSQNNQTEAKAAYLLAEESYGKGDYKAALRYLEAAKQSYGSSNSKMLYLQIQTEIEIGKITPGNDEKILALIDEFEKLPDVGTFSEEKVLEVAKTKLTLKTQLSDAKEKAQKEVQEKLSTEGTLNAFEKDLGWPVGASLADLQAKHPAFAKALTDRLFNKNNIKTTGAGEVIYTYDMTDFYFRNNVLKRISRNKQLFLNSGNDPGGVKGKPALKEILDNYILKYGYMPNPSILADKTSGFYSESYILQAGTKRLLVGYTYFQNTSSCVLMFDTDAGVVK
ncbi:MAG TPA: hypothetical protein VGD22_05700 [Sphingobacteriaceae bacterium]